MTSEVDITNRALLAIGIQKKVNSLDQDSVEAQTASVVIEQIRDDLLRMAPWNCAQAFVNLAYITSAPGTPENTSAGTALWEPGQPAPPWAYEYQYPVDCLKALWIVPQFATGFAGGVPITTAVTGGAPSFWQGPPVRYKVSTDLFYPVTAAVIAVGGTGYAVGDLITLPIGPTTATPVGAPVQLLVATVAAGVILTVTVVNQVAGSDSPLGGSYFAAQTNPVAQSTTSGSGTGATFTLTFGAQASQRVILTNQESATLAYCKQITDPNVMDTLFQSAWVNTLAAQLAMALQGDVNKANRLIGLTNQAIEEARKSDGNEGLTINDVTPDWIRARGYAPVDCGWSPNQSFDWGPTWAGY